MSETLYIRLGSEPQQPCFWLIWSAQENEIIASGELSHADDLQTLSTHANSREVVVFVSGSAVTLKSVELPAKGQRKFIQAIPFMLEEEIADDVDDCSFLLGEIIDNKQQVAIVKREQMQQWLAWLDQAEIIPGKMIPDTLAIPMLDSGWSLLQFENEIVVRQADWKGFCCELDWLEDGLNIALSENPIAQEKNNNQAKITINNFSQLALSSADAEVIPQSPELALLNLAKTTQKFTMLQGAYRIKPKENKVWQVWRHAAILAGVALLANLSFKTIELVSLNSQQNALKEEINKTFKAAFPETRRIVNVRSQLRQKLNALGESDASISVLAMFTQLQPVLSETQLQADSIKFDSKRGELRLQAKANSFNQFETFKRLAEDAGFEVQQGAVNNLDGTIVGSLNIRSNA